MRGTAGLPDTENGVSAFACMAHYCGIITDPLKCHTAVWVELVGSKASGQHGDERRQKHGMVMAARCRGGKGIRGAGDQMTQGKRSREVAEGSGGQHQSGRRGKCQGAALWQGVKNLGGRPSYRAGKWLHGIRER